MHFVYGMREKLSEKCPIISLRSMKDGTMGYEKHKYSRTCIVSILKTASKGFAGYMKESLMTVVFCMNSDMRLNCKYSYKWNSVG